MTAIEGGFVHVVRGVIPRRSLTAIERRLWAEVRERGITADEIAAWHSTTAFPWLRYSDEINALIPLLDELVDVKPGERWCEPQILMMFPDQHTDPIPPHIDQEPDWAGDRRYRTLVGIPIAGGRPVDGAPVIVGPTRRLPIDAEPGDAILMPPRIPHASGRNQGGTVRIIVWYRLLEAPAGAAVSGETP